MANQELKVLLIEDNPGDAFLIKFYLGESTEPVFQVSHAETVKAALDLLEENTFDIILSDMNLPDSFGMDTIKTVLGNYPGNLVIVLTGLSDEEVGLETVKYGAQDFLVKGKFDGKVLISTVMFAFERFKLNKKLDSVSKLLSEENSRLESIQRLLNVGYLEIDIASLKIFRTNFTLQFLGYADASKEIELEQGGTYVEDFENMKSFILNMIQTQNSGEYTYKRSDINKTFRIVFEKKDNKFCGIITRLD
jgi:DNA-binding response OmpR family regulator